MAYLKKLKAKNIYLVGESDEGGDNTVGDGEEEGRGQDPDLLKRLLNQHSLELEIKNKHSADHLIAAYVAESGSSVVQQSPKGVTDTCIMTISQLWKMRLFQKEGLRATLQKSMDAGHFTTAPDEETEVECRCRELLHAIQEVIKPATL